MALAAGTRVGPYEVESLVGIGGMGEVYKARDSRLDRIVAIKFLRADVAGRADRRRALRQRGARDLLTEPPSYLRALRRRRRQTAGRSSSWSISKARRSTIA